MSLPQSIQERLRDSKVIPFVGAGFSRGVKSIDGTPLFPSWSELLMKAADRLDAEKKPTHANLVRALIDEDLYDAARRARQHMGIAHWYEFLKTVFDRTADEADPESLRLNQLVWRLGSNLVITTNYERVLQWSCPDRADFRVWDIEAKVEQINTIRRGNASRPTVWHLHGQIDNTANIILTPDGYQKLYGEKDANTLETNETYLGAIESLRTVLKSHSLLFLGFSLTDAAFIKELTQLNSIYGGAASQHYALLPRQEVERKDLRDLGVEIIFYSDHQELEDLLTLMAVKAQQSSATYVQAERYLVDRREGIYLFGGRGDAFFQLYDQAIQGLQSELDIFSLKLSRFRQKHGNELLNRSQTVRIRLAILDPQFPLPRDNCSIASIRDREERALSGSIMRDVGAWCDLYEKYQAMVEDGTLTITPGCGLEIHLYNALPTVNIFQADNSMFVGPYLLDVEDRQTPTFLIKGDTAERSLGRNLFKAYQAHFAAIWDDKSTRDVKSVAIEERKLWTQGVYGNVHTD